MKGRALAVALIAAASGAAMPVRAEEGNFLTNMFKYGGTTVPPSQPKEVEAPYCPPIDVAEGGAALQSYGGKAGNNTALRSQITFGRLARECTRLQDGSVSVKVGVEGRVLLGPAGSAGRFEAPVRIAIKYGDKVVASRARRVTVAIGSGEVQGTFSIIEDGIVVPLAMTGEYEIEVSLGGGAAREASPKKRKPAVAAGADEAPVQ
ncbi:MAG TPA: hypothetical protein VF641_01110 [Methylobacterium sp.]|jgi:hypothetical protein